MEKALKTDTVKSLSNVLVEASMLPGFEEEHLAIVSQVQDNLHRAKQRESLLVVLQLACDSKKYDHLPYLLGQAKELELSGECHSVVREAAQLLLTYSATSETVETADGQDGMDSRASLTSRDSDDSMDDSDGMGVRQHTNVAGQHHGRMEEDSDDEVSDAEPEATAEVVDSGKQQEPGSSTAVEDGVATLESPSKRLEFLNSTSKGSKLPMTDDYMGSSSGGSLSMAAPKKASRRGSAISYQELIIANKRANEEKHRCKLANTKSKRVFAPEELATREDISKLFRSYSKKLQDLASNSSLNSDLEFLNPMQFVSILRLVVGQKGNLFKEMQAFKK